MAARVKETLSTQAVQSWVYQKWFGSGHGGLIPSLWWASCVSTQQQTFQIKRWGKRRASACARWPEDILDSSELSYQSLWEGSATSVMQRTSWCDSQSFLWSCMCKMLLWLSVITLLTPQYCICYQIWHENTTMCNMKQWALKWGRQKYNYMYILTSYGSSFKCSFFLLNDILNGPSPKQLQTKKNLLNTLAPKKKTKTQRRPAEGALADRSASSVLHAAAWACTSAERQTQSFISLVTESCETVFLTRRAVRRADGLAYQHSLISLPITRRAWRVAERTPFICLFKMHPWVELVEY